MKTCEWWSGKEELIVSACSKRVWGVSEQELWRGCSPRRGPKLQTGSLMMNCKTQTQLPAWICLFAQQLFWAYRFRMIRTTEPSGLMKAQCSRSVSWLADTPTLWDPSHRNLLYGEKIMFGGLPLWSNRTEEILFILMWPKVTCDPVCYLKCAML